MPRVLLISYEFPPMGGVGVQRPTQFAKQLPRSGWDVTVLTVDDPPSSMRDESMLAELPTSTRVRRVWSLEPTRVIQALRRMREGSRPALDTAAAPSAGRSSSRAGFSGMPPWLIKAVQALFIPDEKRMWRGAARREALRAIAEEGVSAIISSGPPHTAHIIARDVSLASGLPWIADFRDPWVGNYFFVPLTTFHAALQRRWERRVVSTASTVLTVTAPMADDLRARHPDLPADRFVVIPNGFDPQQLPTTPVEPADKFTIAYLGAFQAGVNPDAFVTGLRRAIDAGFVPADDVSFKVIGPSADSAVNAASREGLTDALEVTGFLPHGEALEQAASAHVMLLVLDSAPASRPILTGKLLEYLGLGKTVLALVPPGAAADLVTEAHAGPVVSPDDPAAIAAALGELYARWRDGRGLPVPDPLVVERFDRSRQMAAVAALLDRLTEKPAT